MEARCKICFLGREGVGKTSLIIRHIDGVFTENYKSTIGADFLISTRELPQIHPFEETGLAERHRREYQNSSLQVYIWDLGGQVQYLSLREHYLAGASAAIIVFDVTNAASADQIPNWIEEIEHSARYTVPRLIVANKIDLDAWTAEYRDRVLQDRMVDKNQTRGFFLTSAKTGQGVSEVFDFALRELIFTKDKIQVLFKA